jgi:hypothetical protein
MKYIPIFVLTGTSTAPLAFMVSVTRGAVVSVDATGAVSKLHTLLLPIALPARSFTPVVTVAIYVVPGIRLVDGVNVAVFPEYVTVPETGVVPCFRVKVVPVMVETSIASLKLKVISLLTATLVAESPGFIELTMGLVVSALVWSQLHEQADASVTATIIIIDSAIESILLILFI